MKNRLVAISLLVLISVFSAAFALGSREAARRRDAVLGQLEQVNSIVGQLKQLRTEINTTLGTMQENPASTYNDFKKTQEVRFATYSRLESELVAAAPEFEKLDLARRLAGRLVGVHRSLDLAYRTSLETILFAPEQRMKQQWMQRPDTVNEDVFKIEKQLEQISADLSDAGMLALLRMQPVKGKKESTHDRQNIIVILVDTLRADAIGAYDNRSAGDTPTIDRLAEEGVLFEKVWSPAADTYKSVSSMFAGADIYETNSFGGRPWDLGKNLAPLFKKAGYNTIGLSSNSIVSLGNGFADGFDYFYLRYWLPASVLFNDLNSHFRFLHNNDRPFFLYVHYIDPHAPYVSPETLGEIVATGRPEGYRLHIGQIHDDLVRNGINPADVLSAENIEYIKNSYRDEVRYFDKWLDRTLKMFDSLGLLENTVIVLTADHGEAFCEHGDVDHSHQLYKEMIHIPLIVSGTLPPDFGVQERISEPHSLIELFPSLLAWQGIEMRESAASRAILFDKKSILHKDSELHPAPFIAALSDGHSFDLSQHKQELAAIRRGPFKLIFDFTKIEGALFNLEDDPNETVNLYGVEDEMAGQMYLQLVEMRRNSIEANENKEKKEMSKELSDQLRDLGYIK